MRGPYILGIGVVGIIGYAIWYVLNTTLLPSFMPMCGAGTPPDQLQQDTSPHSSHAQGRSETLRLYSRGREAIRGEI
jgi:hypothetical protein